MNKSKSGFSIVEIMIAVIVIGILTSIVVPEYIKTVHRSKNFPKMAALVKVLKLMKSTTGMYPRDCYGAHNIGLVADIPTALSHWKSPCVGLLTNDPANPYPHWGGPYIEGSDSVFLDSWGRPYQFDGDPDSEAGVGNSAIASAGPNGVIDGSWNRGDQRAQGDDIVIYLQ